MATVLDHRSQRWWNATQYSWLLLSIRRSFLKISLSFSRIDRSTHTLANFIPFPHLLFVPLRSRYNFYSPSRSTNLHCALNSNFSIAFPIFKIDASHLPFFTFFSLEMLKLSRLNSFNECLARVEQRNSPQIFPTNWEKLMGRRVVPNRKDLVYVITGRSLSRSTVKRVLGLTRGWTETTRDFVTRPRCDALRNTNDL